jgi:hypothetical protein
VSRLARLRSDYHVDDVATRGQERALMVSSDRWGGVEIRPTRVFVWLGERTPAGQRLLPLGLEPRLLRRPRRRRHVRVGPVTVSYLGNPLTTVALLTFNLLRHLLPARHPRRQGPADGSRPAETRTPS